MKRVSRLVVITLVVLLGTSMLTQTAFAASEKEFVIEQTHGITQVLYVTNVIESIEGNWPDSDIYIKAQAPTKVTFDYNFEIFKITHEEQLYTDVDGLPISSIANESGKVLIPDGPVIPAHYDAGYTLEFTKPGNYRIYTEFVSYPLDINIDIVENMKVEASPTASKVLVNGKEVAFEAYTINGYNYFKLRDIAKVVSGTEKQFEVAWDNDLRTINLLSLKPYTVVGGELKLGDGITKQAILNTSPIYKDGEFIELVAYTINGNNFFKLRDVAKAFDIGVTWDNTTKTIGIDTSIRYTE